jgi:hypothetical protein
MKTETVLETLVYSPFKHPMRLPAQEYVIEWQSRPAYATNARRGSGGVASLSLNFGARWRWAA